MSLAEFKWALIIVSNRNLLRQGYVLGIMYTFTVK